VLPKKIEIKTPAWPNPILPSSIETQTTSHLISSHHITSHLTTINHIPSFDDFQQPSSPIPSPRRIPATIVADAHISTNSRIHRRRCPHLDEFPQPSSPMLLKRSHPPEGHCHEHRGRGRGRGPGEHRARITIAKARQRSTRSEASHCSSTVTSHTAFQQQE
jgi:hypothetical protein